MVNPTKEVKIYPYQCKLEKTLSTSNFWEDKFHRDEVAQNIVEYNPDTFLVIVVDEISNNFVFGRFLKLRSDTVGIINRRDGSERKIELLDEENIREQSHFIVNTEDGLIFAEYNFQAIRHFSTPLSYYLNKLFDTKNNEVQPLPDSTTFTKLKGEEELNVFKLRVAQENLDYLEKKFNLSTARVLLDIAQDKETTFEIVIKKSRKKGSHLNKDKVLELSEKLKTANVEKLAVESEDIFYDLINNNLISFRIIVKTNGRLIDSDDFYFKARNLYDRQIDKLKEKFKQG